MKEVSVVIPVYKVEDYLHQCVDSVLRQTYSALQIILVDDGSPDGCPAICDAYGAKDGRVTVIHKENGGLSHARNAGVQVARGDYILFLDSDDYLEPETVAVLVEKLEQSGADTVECGLRYVFPDHVLEEDSGREMEFSGKEACEKFLDRSLDIKAMVPNKLYRTGMIRQIPFEVGRLHEDMYFTYQVLYASRKYCRVEIPLYNYRQQRPGSIMTVTIGEKNIRDMIAGYQKRNDFFRSAGEELLLEKSKASYFRGLLHLLCRARFCLPEHRQIEKDIRSLLRESKEEIRRNPYMGKAKLAYRLYAVHPGLLYLFYRLTYGDGNITRK